MELKNINWNLGLPGLFSEWKKLFSTHYLLADIAAGITVAFVAIPLSLAIALASGVSPGTGLITAIIAGIVCALFGGSNLGVSGPAAAMTILVADNVEKFGVEGIVLICLIAGLMQLFSGVLGIGKLARYVPMPVIAGFTAGIGVIILIGQLPRAFGLTPPPELHTFQVLNHVAEYLHEINGDCFLLVILTIGIIRGLPKIFPKIPAVLPAVLISSAVAYVFNLNVPLIGDIPHSLPTPHLPKVPNIPFVELIMSSFIIYLLASLETLLSCSAVDKLTKNKKHDSNQELIGQGLGNIAVSLFSGIPVTGVIARSATNVKSGAKTRRSSVIHSGIILAAVFFIAPLISRIPIAALAGVLFSVAFSMVNYKEFYELWKTSQAEALIYAATFFTIIFVDLIAGVQVGIAAACLIVLFRAAKTNLHISTIPSEDILRLTLTGSLTFLSSGKIISLEEILANIKGEQSIILDLSNVTNVDTTGASAIIDLFNQCSERKINFFIKGLSRQFEPIFKSCGGEVLIDNFNLISENELKNKNFISLKSARGRLIHGVSRFYSEEKYTNSRLSAYIAKQQNPHTLFITCSDSRIIPSLMTSSDPGDLFIIRNVGNFIPPYDINRVYSEAAALDFALTALNISDIVVCGHSNCGAMKACMQQSLTPAKLQGWIDLIKSQLLIQGVTDPDEVARKNVLNQIHNLKLYPVVQKKLSEQAINLHAWFFNMDHNLIYEWDGEKNSFKSLISELAPATS